MTGLRGAHLACVVLGCVAGSSALGQAAQDDGQVFSLTIGGQQYGAETIRAEPDGWSATGWFELPGAGRSAYEASVRREGVTTHWALGVDTGQTKLVVEASSAGGDVRGVIQPGDASVELSTQGLAAPFFWENLVWGCFMEAGRHVVSQLDRPDGPTPMTAVHVAGSQTFGVKVDATATTSQLVDGAMATVHLARLTLEGGIEMDFAFDDAGVLLACEVDTQQIRVDRVGTKSLDLTVREPFTLVDSGPWRAQLSPPAFDVISEVGVPATMRDGVALVADITRPQSNKRHPAILVRTPYGRSNETMSKGAYYAKRGYAVITQDVRGRFDSGGEWWPLVHEANDGSDTIDWVARQPWCDGNVGMIGASYGGWVQWYAALGGNPHLKAIVPQVCPPDPDENIPYEGGVFLLSTAWWAKVLEHMASGAVGLPDVDWVEAMKTLPVGAVDEALGIEHPFFDDWLAHPPTDDDYWDPLRYQSSFAEFDLPALHVSGWYDGDQPGSLQNFIGMRRHARTAQSRNGQFLVMGPWGHAFNVTRQMGEVDFGTEAVVDLDALTVRFFDRYLKGVDNGIDDDPPVRVFVMGDDTWRAEEDWPLPSTKPLTLWLTSTGDARGRDGGGQLVPEGTPSRLPFDEYVYDPMDLPDVDVDFNDMTGGSATDDVSTNADRQDDLDYVSPPLSRPLELTGPVEAHLSVSTSALDADFAVSLFRRTPDDKLFPIATGIQRVRRRNGRDEPVSPGEVVDITVDCWATSVVIPAGDRLHVTVASSLFPSFARNPGTLESDATATELQVATQRLHHDGAHVSAIVLPHIPRAGREGIFRAGE